MVELDRRLTQQSDHDLVRLYQETGRHDLFVELVGRHQHLAYRTAFARTGNRELAEEAVQEAFLVLAGPQGRRFLESQGEFRMWFLGVVSNVARHAMRSERRTVRRALGAKYKDTVAAMNRENEPSMAETLDRETREALMHALGELKEEHRLPLILCFLENLSQAEAAKLLGIHQSNVARRIGEGLNQLRMRLQGAGVSMGAIALPVLLKTPNLLEAPVRLQETLMHPGFLKAAATAAAESVRFAPHGWAGKSAVGLKLGIASALFATLLFGGAYLLNGSDASPPKAATSAPAASVAPAVKTAPVEGPKWPRTWLFQQGVPEDIKNKIVQGRWKWEPQDQKNGPCLLPLDGAIVINMPVEFPAQPMAVKAKFFLPRVGEWSWTAHYKKSDLRTYPHRAWNKYLSFGVGNLNELRRRREGTIYFVDRYIVTAIDGKPFCVREYDRPYMCKDVYLVLKLFGMEELAIEPLDPKKLPEILRDVPATIRKLESPCAEVSEDGFEKYMSQHDTKEPKP